MIPGKYYVRGYTDLNRSRISTAAYKGTAVAQKRRKVIRGQSKHKQDKHASKEEVVYAPGAF